ncbi:MAG TPA: fumarylacetoacetate hydrolase family protein [Phycisphaerae bacterium]|nr:fumarylacetoacetate hydrolase family protein [Phycisphaerae bacterium]
MKIARFLDSDGVERLGQPLGDGRARVIEGDLFAEYRMSEEVMPIARLLPPVQPPNIFGIGLNYRRHAAEGGREVPDKPLIFLKATTSVIPSGEPIRLPPAAPDEVDFEAELAIIIGRSASGVTREAALDHVLGYTCVNDVTARDCQKRLDKQWTRAKGFDTFCPLGPWLVTADALDPSAVAVESLLNGRPMQQGNTQDLVFDCPALVSYLSNQFTLLPGTVICTGTPAGVGFARTPQVFLRPGDRVAVRVAGIGTLENPVVG